MRMVDTRTGYLAPGSVMGSTLRVPPFGLLSFKADGPLPAGVTAVVLNITAVTPVAPGYLSAFPLGVDFEEGMQTSVVNFFPGDVRPNMAIMPIGAAGEIVIVNASAGSIDIIVDMSGYFA
jgi:hypothetical protein